MGRCRVKISANSLYSLPLWSFPIEIELLYGWVKMFYDLMLLICPMKIGMQMTKSCPKPPCMVINVLFKNLDIHGWVGEGKILSIFVCSELGEANTIHIYIFQGFRHCLMVTKNVGNGRFTYRGWKDSEQPKDLQEHQTKRDKN